MFKKLITAGVFLVFGAYCVTARDISQLDKRQLTLTLTDGSNQTYRFTSDIKLMYEKADESAYNLILSSDNELFEIPLSEVLSLKVINLPEVVGVESLSSNGFEINFVPNGIEIVNPASEKCMVSIYDVNGRVVYSSQSAESSISISTDQLTTGVYIVKINSLSYKFTKK